MRILGFESSESGGKTPLRSLRSSSMRTGMFPRQSSRVYSQLTVSFPYSWTVSQLVQYIDHWIIGEWRRDYVSKSTCNCVESAAMSVIS